MDATGATRNLFDGRQLVAVSTGPSNVLRNASNLTPEIVPAGLENRLFVFALP